MRYVFTIFLLSTLILLSSCTSKPSPVGANMFVRNNAGSESYDKFYAAKNDTFYYAPILTSSGSFLFTGKTGKTEAVSFLKFSGMPDSVEYDSAVIQIIMDSKFVSEDDRWTFSVHAINDNWDESSKTWDEIENGFWGEQIAFIDIAADTVDTVRFQIDTRWIDIWADSNRTDENNGIAFIASESNNLYKFYSRHNIYSPYLMLYGSTPEDTADYKKLFYPTADIFVANTTQGPESEKIYVQEGTSLRSYMYFDINSIPSASAINKALITLHSDTLDAFPDNNSAFSVDVVGLTAFPTSADDMQMDSSIVDIGFMYSDSSYMEIDVTDLVQTWQGDSTQNFGFIILGDNRYTDLKGRSFYSTNADSAFIPELKIYYNSLPSGRF